MDEYLENKNLEELEQECCIEDGYQHEEATQQENHQVNVNNIHKNMQMNEQSQVNYDEKISLQQEQALENQMIEEQQQNSKDKLKQFQERMAFITELNFKRNYQNQTEFSSQQMVGEDLDIKQSLKLQMEFYFCDTNLTHDSYLRSIISKSPKYCVDIKVFLKFNKIQQILKQIQDKHINSTYGFQNQENKKNHKSSKNRNDSFSKKDLIHLIRDSLKESQILKVKMDSLKVKRRFPFNLEQALKNQKQRTLYIDFLPPKCSKQTLVSIFGNFRIININLPLQKNTQLCQGFAFIEFFSEEEANQALIAKNSSIPKELILLTEKKIGQGSIRIITFKKWQEEKQSFKELSKSQQEQTNQNTKEKRKLSDDFVSVDVQIIQNSLVKIINIPQNTLKAEVVLAVKHLGYEFYCDYLDEISNQLNSKQIIFSNQQQSTIQDSNIQVENNLVLSDKPPQLNDILKVGQAMIRFQNSEEKKLAVQKLLNNNNNKFQIEIRGQLCDIASTITEEEEKNYWNYIKYKKNEFRKLFFLKKQQKKQNATQNHTK
ncbi:hypothetical protein ABPG72_002808 [Tetrahymena utriculariae]